MHVHRQGQGQIALVAQNVFIKALDHHHKGHNAHGKQAQEKGNDKQAEQNIQRAAVCVRDPRK